MPLDWADLISHPSVNMILGFRGRGKSALGYYLVDLIAEEHGLNKVVYSFPFTHRHLLPDEFIIVYDTDDVPASSAVLVDEAYFHAHARRAMSRSNIIFDEFTANSRKRRLTVFYISHHSRKADVNLVLDCNALIFKKPSELQARMERPEIRAFSMKAYEMLRDRGKEYSYVFSFEKDWEGLMQNPPPWFWSQELSDVTMTKKEEKLDVLEKPMYRDALQKILNAYDSGIKEFTWYQVEVPWVILNTLVQRGILEIVYSSRKYRVYRLKDAELVRELLSVL